VDLNPVRAGIVHQAEAYQWSSARAHVTGQDPVSYWTWQAGGKSATPAVGSNCCRSRRKQLRSAGCGTPLARVAPAGIPPSSQKWSSAWAAVCGPDSEAGRCGVRLRCRAGTVTRFCRLTVRYRQ
jgi:hypothetical protein